MKYVIIAGIGTGLVTGVIGGFLGAKVKEWLDMRELKKMVVPFDEDSCSGDCDTCGGSCEDDSWDGK